MIYNDFCGKQLSLLGFGTMRLPTLPDGTVDAALTEAMVDAAIAGGVNYFDTAYPYMNGTSEIFVGKALKKYPRESFYLADKYPGHQIAESYNPAEIFEEQLAKCGVEYFDFYLLHNVYEKSAETYADARWGIVDYFIKQKKLGRIKHLGFSTHAGLDTLKWFIDKYGKHMEFCQIQLNYLDYTLQNAKEKYELLSDAGIPVWVMEPVRGGKLAVLPEEAQRRLPEGEKAPSLAFRWLQRFPNVKMILSGMSDMAQMLDNIASFSERHPLSDSESELLLDIAESLKSSVPCTACRYCTDGCPMGLDIPRLISVYNDMSFSPGLTPTMQLEALPEEKRAAACIACGACVSLCPQNIDIPATLKRLDTLFSAQTSWAELCRQRAEAAKKARASES